jgi:hypothetical protein
VGDPASIYILNETAARIWEFTDGETQVSQIKEKIDEEFELDPEQAEQDLKEHLQQLERIQAIVEEWRSSSPHPRI